MSFDAARVVPADALRGAFRLVRTADAASEPVSTADMKAHLRVESSVSADDSYIDTLVKAARQYLEEVIGISLLTQTWRYSFDQWYAWEFSLPRAAPLQSVSSIKYYDVDNVQQTLDAATYQVDTDAFPGHLRPNWGQVWPSVYYRMAAIQITFVAGYADATAVPATLANAIKFLVGHWYENRASVEVGNVRTVEVPSTFGALIAPYDARVC